jgi:hypothetical protein
MLRRGRGARQNAHSTSTSVGGSLSQWTRRNAVSLEDLRGIPVPKMRDYVVPFSVDRGGGRRMAASFFKSPLRLGSLAHVPLNACAVLSPNSFDEASEDRLRSLPPLARVLFPCRKNAHTWRIKVSYAETRRVAKRVGSTIDAIRAQQAISNGDLPMFTSCPMHISTLTGPAIERETVPMSVPLNADANRCNQHPRIGNRQHQALLKHG